MNLTNNFEYIKYLEGEIEQALFFLTHQTLDFPIQATIARAKELRELQEELNIVKRSEA